MLCSKDYYDSSQQHLSSQSIQDIFSSSRNRCSGQTRRVFSSHEKKCVVTPFPVQSGSPWEYLDFSIVDSFTARDDSSRRRVLPKELTLVHCEDTEPLETRTHASVGAVEPSAPHIGMVSPERPECKDRKIDIMRCSKSKIEQQQERETISPEIDKM